MLHKALGGATAATPEACAARLLSSLRDLLPGRSMATSERSMGPLGPQIQTVAPQAHHHDDLRVGICSHGRRPCLPRPQGGLAIHHVADHQGEAQQQAVVALLVAQVQLIHLFTSTACRPGRSVESWLNHWQAAALQQVSTHC